MPSPNAICDRCASKRKLDTLRKEWNGLMVCPECRDKPNIQERVRGVPDSQGVRKNMRPEPSDVFLTTNQVQPGDL